MVLGVGNPEKNGKTKNSNWQNEYENSELIIDYFTGKIVVYSGYPTENGKHAEVIDLLNPDVNCDDFAILEKGVKYAFGGKLANSFLVCGGWDENGVRIKECYKIGKPTPFLELLQPRFYAASVVLPNNTLLITGESF